MRDAQPEASRAGTGQCLLSGKVLVPGRACGSLRLGITVHCAVGHCRAQRDRLLPRADCKGGPGNPVSSGRHFGPLSVQWQVVWICL